MPSPRLRRRLPAVLALVAALLGVVAAVPAPTASSEADAFGPVPDGYTMQHGWFDSFDGTQLHAGVFLPEDHQPGERHPVLMVITPYTAPNGGALGFGTSGVQVRFPEVLDHPAFVAGRYAYVQVDVRGFGGSEGCFGYYLPPEAADAEVAIEWAAAQDWSTGKVGLWGKSYDAAQQVLALGRDAEGLAATVIQAPGLSAYTALWMNGVHYATGRYATTSVYTLDDVFPPHNASSLGEVGYTEATVSAAAQDPRCRTDAVAMMNVVHDRGDAFWQGKEPYLDARGSDVPTFWTHGFFDANTKPVHLEVWESLTGPKRAWYGQFTHLRAHEGGVGRGAYFLDEAFRFLDEHVRGIAPAVTDPAVTVEEGGLPGGWRTEAQWPPADATAWAMPIRPGTYVDEPGNEADGSGAGRGLWTLSEVLPHDAHLAGEAVVTAEVTALVPGAQVVAHLYDVDDTGLARLVNRGAVRLEAGTQEVSFALYPQDWRFRAGHRIGLVLSASDDSWFTPGVSQTDVTVVGGALELPLLRYRRTVDLPGGASESTLGARPFPVPAAALDEAEVASGAPPAQEERPAG